MPIKIQYNKTYMQLLKKQLAVREKALPTLQAKESALRLEVKKARQEAEAIEGQLLQARAAASASHRLWTEFPEGLARIGDVQIEMRKIAGVATPILKDVAFDIAPHSLVNEPEWVEQGIIVLSELVDLEVRKEVVAQKVQVLEQARRKTTQKVNLYEKVQIPEYKEALLKIKRFMEDEENLAKSAQKILKERLAAAEVAEAA
jgi:V/A-type H+/Na+-transporting ATPase subunit D